MSDEIIDQILSDAAQASARKRGSNWLDAIPDEHRRTLLLIKQRFQATRHETKTLPAKVAENIVKQFEPLGCKFPQTTKTIASWLTSS